MMREYTVFNVAQCEGLPANIVEGKPARVRNPDTRDALADEFLAASGAVIREGAGEAYYAPGQTSLACQHSRHSRARITPPIMRPPRFENRVSSNDASTREHCIDHEGS